MAREDCRWGVAGSDEADGKIGDAKVDSDNIMTTFWLVRHGQTDWNVQGRWQGHADPPLNALGVKQTQILGEGLAHVKFDAIFSSDLDRAYETACAVGNRQGLEVRIEARLREINLGEWEGVTQDEIKRRYPAEWRDRQLNPLEARAPGGESVLELAERVIPAAASISRLYPNGLVLLVSHGLALAVLICHAQGLPLEDAFDS
ncbi:MAG: histidine phosphatase family protein, partial [Chloroflexota bacterium]